MPVQINSDKQGCYARWGDNGHKYYYKCNNSIARKNARSKAQSQGIAIGEYSIEKISFDYDETLTRKSVQDIAKRYIKNGINVYVISARHNVEVMYNLTDVLGIPRTRVFATGSNKNKIDKIKELNITKHYDNNEKVIDKLIGVGELVKFTILERFTAYINFVKNDNTSTKF